MGLFDGLFGKNTGKTKEKTISNPEKEKRIDAAFSELQDYFQKVAPKWQYLLIEPYYDQKDKDYYFMYSNKKLPLNQLSDILQELGAYGWEMTGSSSLITSEKPAFADFTLTSTQRERLFFKRPIPKEIPDDLKEAFRQACDS